MGRKAVGPRLWFRPDRHHSTRGNLELGKWLIRDGTKMISTGFGEGQRAEAELALADYIGKRRSTITYFVYFVSCAAPNFPIKIGISQNRIARFSHLQNAMPYPIEVLALHMTSDPLFERRLHRQFSHLRLRGEWFERDPEIMALIETLQESGAAA